MSAEIESMAYRYGTAVPWHGLGATIPADATLDDCIRIANLGWQVIPCRLAFRDPSQLNSDGKGVVKEAEDYRAIVRESDGTIFTVASDRYTPVQNTEMIGLFREACDSMGLQIDTLGALRGGAVVWALAQLPNGYQAGNGDPLVGYILMANSHDGSLQFNGRCVGTRVVCMNTLRLALGERTQHTFSAKHTANVHTRIKEGAALLGLARTAMARYEAEAQELAAVPCEIGGQLMYEYLIRLTHPELLNTVVQVQQASMGQGSLLDAILADSQLQTPKVWSDNDLNRVGKAILANIMDSPGSSEAGQTWWRVENGVTRWVDHDAGRSQDNRLHSAWFGQRDALKSTAHELALNYARQGQS